MHKWETGVGQWKGKSFSTRKHASYHAPVSQTEVEGC